MRVCSRNRVRLCVAFNLKCGSILLPNAIDGRITLAAHSNSNPCLAKPGERTPLKDDRRVRFFL